MYIQTSNYVVNIYLQK